MGLLADIFGVFGKIQAYNDAKTDDKATAAWNAWDRQTDMYALNGLMKQLERRRETLQLTGQVSADQHALLTENIETLRNRANINRRHGLQEAGDFRWRNQRDYEMAKAELGVRARELDLVGGQIASERQLIVRERMALERNTGARGTLLDAQIAQALVERGLFTEQQSSQLRVYDSMNRVLDAEEAELLLTQPEREREIAKRLAAIDSNIQLVGMEEAFAIAQAFEDAALAAGEVAAGQAARGHAGSFGETEGARIGRQRLRARTLATAQANVQRRGLEARGAEATRDLLLGRRQTGAALARLEHRRVEVGEGRTGLGREARAYDSRFATRQAEFGAQRAALTSERQVGRQRLAGRETELTGREGVLGARRQQAAFGATAAAEDYRRGKGEAWRMETEAQQAYAEDQFAVGQGVIAAEQAGIRTQEISGQIADVETAEAIAKWQSETLPDLPMRGSSRSGTSLIIGIGAELAS